MSEAIKDSEACDSGTCYHTVAECPAHQAAASASSESAECASIAPAQQSTDPRAWDGSTVHVESAIAADNPSREENIRTIASRLARFNALEIQRDALREALVGELSNLRAWMEFLLKHKIRSRAGEVPPSYTDGYSYVDVPEWDMRQKLDSICAAIAAAEGGE